MGKVKLGMHASLWAAEWTREAAELAVAEAAEHELEVIEFPLLVPEAVDAPHSRAVREARYRAHLLALLAAGQDGGL
jgi:D-psicose/D-tagatose/L-ribulose 3-epimerase